MLKYKFTDGLGDDYEVWLETDDIHAEVPIRVVSRGHHHEKYNKHLAEKLACMSFGPGGFVENPTTVARLVMAFRSPYYKGLYQPQLLEGEELIPLVDEDAREQGEERKRLRARLEKEYGDGVILE